MNDLIGRRVRYTCIYPGCNPVHHPSEGYEDFGTILDYLGGSGEYLIRWDSDGRVLPDPVPANDPGVFTIELIDE